MPVPSESCALSDIISGNHYNAHGSHAPWYYWAGRTLVLVGETGGVPNRKARQAGPF
jgi:hypothetical protein